MTTKIRILKYLWRSIRKECHVPYPVSYFKTWVNIIDDGYVRCPNKAWNMGILTMDKHFFNIKGVYWYDFNDAITEYWGENTVFHNYQDYVDFRLAWHKEYAKNLKFIIWWLENH